MIDLSKNFSSLLNTSVKNSWKDRKGALPALTAYHYVWNLRRAARKSKGAGLPPAGRCSRYSTSVWVILTCCQKNKSWTWARLLRCSSALSKINRKPVLFSGAMRLCYRLMPVEPPREASWEEPEPHFPPPRTACLHVYINRKSFGPLESCEERWTSTYMKNNTA